MSDEIASLIGARRKEVRRRLKIALRGEANAPELQDLANELKAIDELAGRSRRPIPVWAVASGVLAIALFAIAVALTVRLPRVNMIFDGTVTSVRVAANGWTTDRAIVLKAGTLAAVGGHIEGLSIEAVSNVLGTASQIASLDIPAGTVIEVGREKAAGPKCFFIRPDAIPMSFVVLRGQVLSDVKLHRVAIPVGGQVNFCVATVARLMAVLVSRVALESTLRSDPPPGIFGSSIVTGALTTGETGIERKLSDNDRVNVAALSDATAILELDEKLRVRFSGVSRNAAVFGRVSFPGEAGENLRPTLFEIARSSPAFAALIGSLTALVGLLWSVWEKLR